MSAGNKALGNEVPIVVWLFIEIARDKHSRADRRSVRDAASVVSDYFKSLGRDIPPASLRRQHAEAQRLIDRSPAGRRQSEASLAEIRARRETLGWDAPPPFLLGFSIDDVAAWLADPRRGLKGLEIAALRASLRDLEAQHRALDATIEQLEADRERLLHEAAGGKPH